jgi:TRAP-type C4-dicarboxylate transport system permease small subunit
MVNALILAFLATIVYQGYKILPVMAVRVAPTLRISMSIVYVVLPLSAAIMVLHILAQAAEDLWAKNEER